MEYNEAIEYYVSAGKCAHAPTTEIMRELCRRLGDPQSALRCVHVAGTNGKGSCAAMLASMLRAQGLRTGLYTSPDLVDMAERIQIDGSSIRHEDILRLTPRIRAAAQGLPSPSFFELFTALGFLYFAESRCDVVVLECGLGGLYDATNVIERPLVSVIAPIGMDHMALLGGTLASIAREKAGIVKPSCPVVSAMQEPEAAAVLRGVCAQRGAPLCEVDPSQLRPVSADADGQIFDYKEFRGLRLRLLGPHQQQNAVLAVEAARCLGLPEDALRRGLAEAVWPCRFELLRREPPFLLDGAHNPHGATALAAGLRVCFPGLRFALIVGVMADKDYRGMLELLEPLASRVFCLAPDSPRALPAEELAACVRTVPAVSCGSLAEALRLAEGCGEPVCAFGSLYYIGHLRRLLEAGQPS